MQERSRVATNCSACYYNFDVFVFPPVSASLFLSVWCRDSDFRQPWKRVKKLRCDTPLESSSSELNDRHFDGHFLLFCFPIVSSPFQAFYRTNSQLHGFGSVQWVFDAIARSAIDFEMDAISFMAKWKDQERAHGASWQTDFHISQVTVWRSSVRPHVHIIILIMFHSLLPRTVILISIVRLFCRQRRRAHGFTHDAHVIELFRRSHTTSWIRI